jgi:hypothetical protein
MGQPLHRGKGRKRGKKGRGKEVIVDVVHISTFVKDVLKKC